jgi:hypothetical protein
MEQFEQFGFSTNKKPWLLLFIAASIVPARCQPCGQTCLVDTAFISPRTSSLFVLPVPINMKPWDFRRTSSKARDRPAVSLSANTENDKDLAFSDLTRQISWEILDTARKCAVKNKGQYETALSENQNDLETWEVSAALAEPTQRAFTPLPTQVIAVHRTTLPLKLPGPFDLGSVIAKIPLLGACIGMHTMLAYILGPESSTHHHS